MRTRPAAPLSLLPLLLAALVPAQTHQVSPPGFANKTGGARSWGLAAYPDGRTQLADGMFRNQAMVLKGISFRLTSPTTGYWNPARSFSTVTLRMSEADIKTMTGTFASNLRRTPVQVFQQPVNLPFVTGPHQSVPAPWSLHFPFATSWVYTGVDDILADFEFSGGKLGNGQPWSTNPNAYLWDAPKGSPWAYGIARQLGNSHANGCVDSNTPATTLGGRALLNLVHYDPRDPFNPLAGQLVIEQSAISFGPNAPAVTLLGFQPLPTGVPFPGVTCNRLHVGTALPTLLTQVAANAIGRVPAHHPATGAGGVPMQSAYVGVSVVVQGAWNDTVTGKLQLSSAAGTTIPPLPGIFALAAVHGADKLSGRPSVDAGSNHIRRYTR